jgi:hypothetical protein
MNYLTIVLYMLNWIGFRIHFIYYYHDVITDVGITVTASSEYYYHNIFPYTSLRMVSKQNYTMYRTGKGKKTDCTQFIVKGSVRFDQKILWIITHLDYICVNKVCP